MTTEEIIKEINEVAASIDLHKYIIDKEKLSKEEVFNRRVEFVTNKLRLAALNAIGRDKFGFTAKTNFGWNWNSPIIKESEVVLNSNNDVTSFIENMANTIVKSLVEETPLEIAVRILNRYCQTESAYVMSELVWNAETKKYVTIKDNILVRIAVIQGGGEKCIAIANMHLESMEIIHLDKTWNISASYLNNKVVLSKDGRNIHLQDMLSFAKDVFPEDTIIEL